MEPSHITNSGLIILISILPNLLAIILIYLPQYHEILYLYNFIMFKPYVILLGFTFRPY